MERMVQKTKRNIQMDIVKGLAIALVVIGHTRKPGWNFIYLFHMAVFFIASGYFYNLKNSSSITDVITFAQKKIRALWLPWFLGSSILILLNNVFMKINVYTYVKEQYASLHSYSNITEIITEIGKAAVFSGGTQLGGTFWFFKALFITSIMFCLTDWIITLICENQKWHIVFQGMMSVLFLLIGYLLSEKNIAAFGIARSLSMYWLCYFGYLFKITLKERLDEKKVYVIAVISLLVLIAMNKIGSINLDRNEYYNPLFFICVSISGWFFLYGISAFLNDSKLPRTLKNVGGGIAYMGQHSLAIMIGHFLAFKLVNCIGVLIAGLPMCCIAAFPVLFDDHAWWIIYTIVGIVIPLCVAEVWSKFKTRIKE